MHNNILKCKHRVKINDFCHSVIFRMLLNKQKINALVADQRGYQGVSFRADDNYIISGTVLKNRHKVQNKSIKITIFGALQNVSYQDNVGCSLLHKFNRSHSR